MVREEREWNHIKPEKGEQDGKGEKQQKPVQLIKTVTNIVGINQM